MVNLIMNGGKSGIRGGKCYWYFRLEILLVWSAVNITGISAESITGMVGGNITGKFGGNCYWYGRAEILQRRVAFVGWVKYKSSSYDVGPDKEVPSWSLDILKYFKYTKYTK